jgi:hypothetical protein
LTSANSYHFVIEKSVPQPAASIASKKSSRLFLSAVLLAGFVTSTTSYVGAQQLSPPTAVTNSTLQTKIKAFLEPEAGLNNEIRAGLARLEQTCEFTNKTKPSATTAAPLYSKSALISKDIVAARAMANEQQAIADKAIAEFRSAQSLSMNTCSALPSLLRISEQCIRYQKNSEIAQAVSQASQTYFNEALARFKSYEAAVDLEAKGCTRPDFAYKLWAAEQVHIVPKLKTSGQQLSDLLK